MTGDRETNCTRLQGVNIDSFFPGGDSRAARNNGQNASRDGNPPALRAISGISTWHSSCNWGYNNL